MKNTFLVFAALLTTMVAECTVVDADEEACKNFDEQCKDTSTLVDGELVPVPACRKDQFDEYRNSASVMNCVIDAKSCFSAQACIDGAKKK